MGQEMDTSYRKAYSHVCTMLLEPLEYFNQIPSYRQLSLTEMNCPNYSLVCVLCSVEIYQSRVLYKASMLLYCPNMDIFESESWCYI